jgi:hypothetical protein
MDKRHIPNDMNTTLHNEVAPHMVLFTLTSDDNDDDDDRDNGNNDDAESANGVN